MYLLKNYLIRNYVMENDQQRFDKETSEEAAYWFTVSDCVSLIEEYGMEKVLTDVVQLRDRTKKVATEQKEMFDCPFNSSGC
jgi:hypothetical protein